MELNDDLNGEWLSLAQSSPYYCSDTASAHMVLSIGNTSPGAFPGEPTYGDTPPSYHYRTLAINGSVDVPRHIVRVWDWEQKLMETAAYDARLGFFILRHADLRDTSTLEPHELIEVMHTATQNEHRDSLLIDVLNIQQWILNHSRSFRVYDLQLCFFEDKVRFHTKGWAFPCKPTTPQNILAFDNIVSLFRLGG